MTLDLTRTRNHLKNYNLPALFIEELGWNHHPELKIKVFVDNQEFILVAVAEKCGMVVFACSPDSKGLIPDFSTQRKIERQVTKNVHEHLIVFTDMAKKNQLWQWVRREHGKPAACRTHPFHAGQSGELLLQKLGALAVSLSEEEAGLTLPDVTGRARRAFDVEKMTKRFYDRFKAEHDAFLKFLKGIPDKELDSWYISVMLNRLMFIYFIQKKGFLGGDTDYLRHKLSESLKKGKDQYYQMFLCPLFFEGFAKRNEERSEKSKKLLGNVPYLNGGIFLPHQIEVIHGKTIEIPDKAFEKIFDFFDAYQWHLDERPLRNDNEINPDVLGYIFEKYINQKQMGAYYTKEDITGYISKNTVIPYLFDAAKKKCKVAFEGDKSVLKLLQEDPDRYIYDAVKHGIAVDIHSNPVKRLEKLLELPQEIALGLKDVSKRGEWNKSAPPEYALSTEIWREIVARRNRYEEVKAILQRGEIQEINDFVTYNLDIRQFVQDVIENCEGPDLLMAFWRAIEEVTVLDPACGSGAFLFAALNLLDPLYEACLNRMEFFLEEWGEEGGKNHPNYHKEFSEILKRIGEHPNHDYFIFKSIIINNLYGVDIMEEAVEICKLRLFLKLMAQVEKVEQVEPLPDIDFNIKAGNTLVGFATIEEVEKIQEGTFDFGTGEMDRIEGDATLADKAFKHFHEMQTRKFMGPEDFKEAKEDLRSRLKKLNDVLDKYLAKEYGVKLDKKGEFEKWRKNHHPFHWFTEFYGILKDGGFDVIIGNPPYVDLKNNLGYQLRGYETLETNNLYPLFLERNFRFSSKASRIGMIVPVSSISTEGYLSLQKLLFSHSGHFSSFDDRPARLFDGLEHIQLTIPLIETKITDQPKIMVTECYRWSALERPYLFSKIKYVAGFKNLLPGTLSKISNSTEEKIIQKIITERIQLGIQFSKMGKWQVYYSRKVHNFLQVLDFMPKVFDGKGIQREPSELKHLNFDKKEMSLITLCALNSTLFRWFINIFTDCRHVNKREVDGFPLNLLRANTLGGEKWSDLALRLSNRLKETSEFRVMKFKHDTLKVQCVIPKLSKSIIDEIDKMLAKHYGFTDEELDFIINYDIKYRMGKEGLNEEE